MHTVACMLFLVPSLAILSSFLESNQTPKKELQGIPVVTHDVCDPYFDTVGCSYPGCRPVYPTPSCALNCLVTVNFDQHDIMAEIFIRRNRLRSPSLFMS
ncbi:hypothetical protein QQP08_000138 [Theobroma cacao]|nr:hypothetical protein QQP08_000138 [Theobroma cacao]